MFKSKFKILKSKIPHLWLLACLTIQAEPAVTPLPSAHAHNDYLHPRPLLDALSRGFCSVEADIYLIEGRLLVAHDLNKTKPEATLQALYLDPLRAQIRQNHGRVYPGGPGFNLLIDIKSEAQPTYAALRDALVPYKEFLTSFTANATQTNAVTVIISGNRAPELMAREPSRLAGLDGRLTDLAPNPSPALMPLISDNWNNHFQWRGQGPLPDGERQHLRALVSKIHAQKRQARFWAVPDTPECWTELRAAGVDWINTDNLDGLQAFLSQPRPQ